MAQTEAQRDASRRWKLKNRAKVKASRKAYYHAHRAEALEQRAAYRAAHRDEVSKEYSKWRSEHKGLRRRYLRRWRSKNPDKVVAANSQRRSFHSNCTGCYTAEEWQALKHRYEFACLRCGIKEPHIKLTPDHVVPLVKGGTNSIDNIQPLCGPCNSSKHDKTTDYRVKERS